MSYSLHDLYRQGMSAWNKPFEHQTDKTKIYRITKAALECWDSTAGDWITSDHQIDPNLSEYVDSAKGLLRRYEVQEGYVMQDGTFKQVRVNTELTRDEQL